MRELREIPIEVEIGWNLIRNAAARYALNCMKVMGAIGSPHKADPNGYSIVRTFLGSSRGWRGSVALRINTELRGMYKRGKPM